MMLKRTRPLQLIRFCAVFLMASMFSTFASAGEDPAVKALEQEVQGLWRYTGLTRQDGTEMPLAGIFLFKDGIFLQQAVFNADDFAAAGSMAHAGPFRAEPATGSVHLIAAQTISTDPAASPPLSFRANTEHDVTVTREDTALTLIFGLGTSTVQNFEWVGPGEGELYALEKGSLAFVDGHFILVDGDETSATSAYGTYEQDDENLTLQVTRWTDADTSSATNLRDTTLEATFDGKTLSLADGRSFKVK